MASDSDGSSGDSGSASESGRPHFSMTYDTLQEAKDSIYADAKFQKFGIAIRRSHPDRKTGLPRRVDMVCSRSTTYKPRSTAKPRIKDTSSVKIACPWKVSVVKYKNHEKWKVVVRNKQHNHEPADTASALVDHRQRELATILENIEQSTETPAIILDNLRKKNPATTIKRKDIYNARSKLRHKRLGRYTPTQLLLKALHEKNWFVKYVLEDGSKRVKRLFFVNKHVADLLRKNPEVIVMDCTYKINRYGMPMLVIMGHTALNTSFYVAFGFIDNEEKDNFTWVMEMLKGLYRHLGLKDPEVIVTDRDLALMEAIANVFPEVANLLCVWHINMNVLKNCKPAFDVEEDWEKFYNAWHEVINASDEEGFNTAWQTFRRKYRRDHEEEINYLKNTWLKRHRHRFCHAWTNEVTHFDTLTTSRVEGGHRVLKAELKVSTGDLLNVVDAIEEVLSRQYHDYITSLGEQKQKTPYKVPRELMRDLISEVTPYALSKVYTQYQLVKAAERDPVQNELKACNKVFSTTMGLPCCHMIRAAMDTEEKKILLDDIHPHWRFNKPDSSLLTATSDFSSDPAPVFGQVFYESPAERFDDSSSGSDLPEVNDLIHGRTNRIDSPPPSPASEISELNGLSNINEPNVVKAKGRPRGSQNKKGVMTRAEKKAAKSNKRDPSGFELTQQNLAKRARKNVAAENTRGRERRGAGEKGRGRGGRGRGDRGRGDRGRGRGGRERREEGRGEAVTTTVSAASRPPTPMMTRSGANASKPVELSSNTESTESGDDDVGNPPHISSDDDFNASKQGDEDRLDEWMNSME